MKSKRWFCTENLMALIFWVATFIYPFTTSGYKVDNFTYYFIMIVFMLSLYLLWGYTGIFSFGQAAFFGIGAYVYGIFSKASPKSTGMGLLGIVLGCVIPMILALILGIFIYYGHINASFIGIITFCLSLTLQTFMTQTSGPEWQILGVKLGGFNGLNKIPAIHLGGFQIKGMTMYFVSFAIALGAYILFRVIQKSNFGYTMLSIRENPERSELFGYDTAKISTIVFAIGGGIAGFAGVLFASWGAYVVPSTLSTSTSFIAVIIIALAGRYSVTGATIFTFFYVWFTRAMAAAGSEYSQVLQGLLLVIIILFIPRGIGETIFSFGDSLLKKLTPKKSSKVRVAKKLSPGKG